MNKLLIDNNIKEEQIVVDTDMDITMNFSDISKGLIIQVMNGVCLRIFDTSNNTNNNITYNIGEYCNVIINKLSTNCSDTVTINLNEEHSIIKFYSSIINYDSNIYNQNINHNNKNAESKIVNHCINVLDNEFKFIVNGTIKNSGQNTIFKQDNKIINIKNGKSFILPNLIVDNNDIEASHSAYIGNFDEDIIFYLMTRGLSKKDSNNLLIKAFLLNNMELEDKEKDIFNGIIENINM